MKRPCRFLFTQHAGLPLQQRQDVLVEEERAEAEEVPQAQVGHGAPVPQARLGLDDGGLSDGDLQHLLPGQALAAGQHHALLPAAQRRQQPPQRVQDAVPAAWHGGASSLRGPRGPQQVGGRREVRGRAEVPLSVHLLTGPTVDQTFSLAVKLLVQSCKDRDSSVSFQNHKSLLYPAALRLDPLDPRPDRS